jgi:hypothetical protein
MVKLETVFMSGYFQVSSQAVSFKELALMQHGSHEATYLAFGKSKVSDLAEGWKTPGCNLGSHSVMGTEFGKVHSLS